MLSFEQDFKHVLFNFFFHFTLFLFPFFSYSLTRIQIAFLICSQMEPTNAQVSLEIVVTHFITIGNDFHDDDVMLYLLLVLRSFVNP